MFPNNYNMPFSMPYNNMMGINPRMGLGLKSGFGVSPRTGLFSRLFGSARGINFQSILNTASRTLGVVNQAIPVVKQIGPMYNNMKSMLKIASLFKDETDPPKKKNTINQDINNTNIEKNEKKENTITSNNYSNSPSFFI